MRHNFVRLMSYYDQHFDRLETIKKVRKGRSAPLQYQINNSYVLFIEVVGQ